jgi:hypothetical protein
VEKRNVLNSLTHFELVRSDNVVEVLYVALSMGAKSIGLGHVYNIPCYKHPSFKHGFKLWLTGSRRAHLSTII